MPDESDSETCVQHDAAAHGHANDGRHAHATAHATHDVSPDAYGVSFKR